MVRPRKSNFTSPACSTYFMENWVTSVSAFGSRYSGTRSISGRSPITTPAAWVLAWRYSPSSCSATSISRRIALVAVAHLLQARLAVDGLLDKRDGLGRVVGDQLGHPVHLAERQPQHPPHVAHRGPRLQLAEGDDLRHPVPRPYSRRT